MAAPFELPDLMDLYRPFGASSPIDTGIPCRIVPNERYGRGEAVGTTYLTWSHWVDLESNYDIRDGCSRAAGTNYITYADGDQVEATLEGKTWRFVVVWVEKRYTNTDRNYTRAYLVRDRVYW